MPISSAGLIALLVIIGLGVVFLLWVFYHLMQESRPRRERHSEWPVASQVQTSSAQPRNLATRSATVGPVIRAS